MKQPNITPGPWKTRELQGFPLQIASKPDADGFGKPIADCSDYSPANTANARAIAAVPALLEALEHALPGLESDLLYCERHPQLDGLNQEACLAHKRSRITKARAALIAAGYQF